MGNDTSVCGCHQTEILEDEEPPPFEKTPVKKPSLCCQCDDDEPSLTLESRAARDHAFLKDFASEMKVGVLVGETRLRIIKHDILFLEPLCYVQDIKAVRGDENELRIEATDDRVWTMKSDQRDTVELLRNGLNLLIRHERKRRASKRRRSSPLKEVQLNLETRTAQSA